MINANRGNQDHFKREILGREVPVLRIEWIEW
jgi:hypothetical protein